MHSPARRRILVVAHRSVATPAIVDEVRHQAGSQPSDIALLIPDAADPATAASTRASTPARPWSSTTSRPRTRR